jgi:hypothetical protein
MRTRIAPTFAPALLLALAHAAATTACGGKAVFRLSADENNAYALKEALSRRQLPAAPAPTNTAHAPRVYALAAGAPKKIVAYDLATGAVLWQTDADVRSRIAAGGDFVVALEAQQLVARDAARGTPRWRAAVPGDFVGLAADAARAYVVYRTGKTYWLAGHDGASGKLLWKADAVGALGAPAAHGGLVLVPFLSQWLSIVDGKSGAQLTRLRGIDEQISAIRATSTGAYYGSKQGLFLLDARSSSGTRATATYGHVAIPAQLERTSYAPDAYDPIQQTYSAADRARVLFAAVPVAAGPMKLAGDTYAIHYFRFVFGFAPDGELRWAYSHPRVELVTSEHTGAVIAAVSSAGDIVAVDPATGAVRARKSLGANLTVLGATFDADGWAPTDPAAADPAAAAASTTSTAAALASIARDRDSRFDRVKELAVAALAKLPGPDVTRELLGVIGDPRAPARLKDATAQLLAKRREPASLPVLAEALATKTDYLAGTSPDALAPAARAIAGLAGQPLDPAQTSTALAALAAHLDAPTTTPGELAAVISAMSAIGGGAERPALAAHLLLYHVDDELGSDPAWQRAIVSALAAKSGTVDRDLLRRVVADPRTRPTLGAALRDALGPE